MVLVGCCLVDAYKGVYVSGLYMSKKKREDKIKYLGSGEVQARHGG